jgi:hypothetical protein
MIPKADVGNAESTTEYSGVYAIMNAKNVLNSADSEVVAIRSQIARFGVTSAGHPSRLFRRRGKADIGLFGCPWRSGSIPDRECSADSRYVVSSMVRSYLRRPRT